MDSEKIVQYIENYTAMYTSYIESNDRSDSDNAEFFRVAAIVLREVRLDAMEGKAVDPAGTIDFYRRTCMNYVETGKRLNAVDDVLSDMHRQLVSASVVESDPKAKVERKKPLPPPKPDFLTLPATSLPVSVHCESSSEVPMMANLDVMEMIITNISEMLGQ